MTKMSISAREERALQGRSISRWPASTWSWMFAAFFIAFASAATALAIFGDGERGISIALRITARWSFVLFWLAYVGGAMARLFGPRLAGLARRGRDLGLAFASAQLVHVGLVLWIIHIATRPGGAMVFFWVGILCTYLLALLSLPLLHDALEPRLWRLLRTVSMEYIALAFAADFILLQLQAKGLGKYPLSYLPFALLLIAGTGLRVVAHARHQLLQHQPQT